jgi:hypothetical protein
MYHPSCIWHNILGGNGTRGDVEAKVGLDGVTNKLLIEAILDRGLNVVCVHTNSGGAEDDYSRKNHERVQSQRMQKFDDEMIIQILSNV